jgi:uncharacterized protein
MYTYFLIFGAGILAGAMNGLAGGGSFVSLPALIAAGVPPVQANSSSTVALFPGGVASAWAYRDGIGPVGSVTVRALLIATLCGGLAGAVLLLRTTSAAFSFALPWLLLFASVALAFGRRFGEALRGRRRIPGAVVLVVQFGLGIYGGYFGGAVGLMMMAVWTLIDAAELKAMAAPRALLVTATNGAAVLCFAITGSVRWPETLAMMVSAIAGGYYGARFARHLPPAALRWFVVALSGTVTIAFFLRKY